MPASHYIRSSDKQRDLKLALQLQCAWPPAGPNELITGRCVQAVRQLKRLQCVLAADLGHVLRVTIVL